MASFATGYLYFGLHKVSDGWIFREWAPNATSIYLIGTCNGWQKDPAYKLNNIGSGVWEIFIPEHALHHGDLYKLWIEWNGGAGERIPAWCRRVVQDTESKIFSAQVWNPSVPYVFKNKKFVKSISGCNSMYRKEDVIACGGFNASLSTAEDTDLNNRMLDLGKLLYTPDAIILHNHKRGLKDFCKRMYQYGYGRAKSRLWDLQVIPPIFGLLLLCVSIIFNYWILFVASLIYISIIAVTGLILSIQHKEPLYLLSVPTVYILEHSFYSLGFLRGLFER